MSSQTTSAVTSTLHTTTATRKPGAPRVAASRASDARRARWTSAATINTATTTRRARNAPGLNGSRSVNHHPYTRRTIHAAATRSGHRFQRRASKTSRFLIRRLIPPNRRIGDGERQNSHRRVFPRRVLVRDGAVPAGGVDPVPLDQEVQPTERHVRQRSVGDGVGG